MLALTLTGCNSGQETPSPIPTGSATTMPTSPVETPLVEPTTPTDAELEDVVKSYNQEVDASNDKARDVLENYTGQIESVTGK